MPVWCASNPCLAVGWWSGDDQTQRDRNCETAFYLAEASLLQHRDSEAIPLLRQAREACPAKLIEYHSAATELRRLGDPSQLNPLAGCVRISCGFTAHLLLQIVVFGKSGTLSAFVSYGTIRVGPSASPMLGISPRGRMQLIYPLA